jgi:ABC-2 type transport system permease protein
LAFILSLVSIIFIGRTIIFFYCILIGSSAFKFINNSGFIRTFGHIFIFTSGSTFPLDIIDQVQWLQFLPFAYTFYHPMQIYLGNYNFQETLSVFAGGIAWCIILYFLAKLVFKKGLKRNEAVGL